MSVFVVVEGPPAAFADAVAEARASGRTVATGWSEHPDPGALHAGTVATAADAAAAVLTAVAGASLLVDARAPREVIDRLCEDLRRLGTLDHRVGGGARTPRLSRQERELVRLLLEGRTLTESARLLGISRRTADRRLASIRSKAGVESTAEALVRLTGANAAGR